MKLSILSLKSETVLKFLRLESKLFHTVMKKTNFWKRTRRILPTFLLAYDVLLTGMRLKRYFEWSIFENLIKEKRFLCLRQTEGILGLMLGRFYFRRTSNGFCYCQTDIILNGFHFCVERITKGLVIEYIIII